MRHAYRTALVTGASSGIGESFARLLAARGTDLVIVARRAELLDGLARELVERYRVAVEVLAADLTDPGQRAEVEGRLRAEPVELLVNNAGHGAFGAFADLPLDDHLAQIELNVAALVRLTHAVLPGMVARGRGGVLNVASMSGFAPSPGSATYGATKAYVASFSESLHSEVAGRGVHVTALCPGFTRTEDDVPPSLLWLRRDDVARAGLEAVSAGRALCVPGAQYKAAFPALKLVPRPLLRAAVNRMWHQAAETR
ncbi:SDR family NAD(P)-dependent oxidoreductase [Actinomadura madurae]|uniref:SDR family NAD(P)-dependent oxidoreductase n=1 Tax=Actinomadura madurae TaxID=1993 RepID=UPI0020263EE7|nr:SDR family oxidoreductase [Actinomadura madurae]MCP9954276.1 SDR family oxidoreductase [Actinomadura madurae]MCP9971028.1 SDR family oxidoreductase [Actinomadura madurae]MCQ0004925.1 SDR family oxidoreductase [Actinomadura madurae]MCQ0019746.1 SDR family oxidoreductase [Actinomadura madurae]URN01937.1 SDR family oxidoreductase [Actinomadura madurae]